MLKQLFLIGLLFPFNSYAVTNSEKFNNLNSDSIERQTFVKEQNARVNLRLKSSKNFKKIEKDFIDLGKESKKKEIVGSNKKTYTLYDRGLGKPQELIEKNTDESTRLIFSSFKLARNNSYNVVNFKISPESSKAVIVLSHKGSTDGYTLVTVDIESGNILYRSEDRGFYATSFVFNDDNSIINFSRENETVNALSILNGEKTKIILENVIDTEEYENFLHVLKSDNHNLIIAQDELYDLGEMGNIEILAKSGKILILKHLQVVNEKETIAVLAYNLEINAVVKVMEMEGEPYEIHVFEKNLIVEKLEALKRELILYDYKGNQVSNVHINFCCQVSSLKVFLDPETQLLSSVKLTLKSPVKNQDVEWDFNQKNFVISEEAISSMLESKELSLVVEEKNVPSFDGTMIPYLMIYKKGIMPVEVPVYLEVYGGFRDTSTFRNSFDAYIRKFIQHGGLFIAPGVRGGGEYGRGWHTAAKKENKHKTFEDVASIAKQLIEKNISVREKIVIAGSSNGGLTVAATGLMFPQYFGLVIPHNGVFDMLGKEVLDTHFDNGWSREYGDSRIEENFKFISKYSPLEKVTEVKDQPRFLVINGRTDTRVNPAHSIKFTAAAKSANLNNVELISINNSGHFNLSISYSDFIAWRTNSIKWATIYDVLGMEY